MHKHRTSNFIDESTALLDQAGLNIGVKISKQSSKSISLVMNLGVPSCTIMLCSKVELLMWHLGLQLLLETGETALTCG